MKRLALFLGLFGCGDNLVLDKADMVTGCYPPIVLDQCCVCLIGTKVTLCKQYPGCAANFCPVPQNADMGSLECPEK